MKALFIGGTGTISTAITQLVAQTPGWELYLLNQGIHQTIDYILSHPEQQVEDPEFDAWCDRVIATLEEAKRSLM